MAYPDGPTGGPWHQAPAAYPPPWEQRDADESSNGEDPDEAGRGAHRGADVEPGPNGTPEPALGSPEATGTPDAAEPTNPTDAEPDPDQPTTDTTRPDTAADQPTAGADHATAEQPGDAAEQPGDAAEQPGDAAEQPAADAEQPAADAGQHTAGAGPVDPAEEQGAAPEAEAPTVIALAGPLRPGDLADSPISVWEPERAEELRRRFAEAVPRFIDDPAGAVALGSSVVVEAVTALTEALRNRQDQLDPARTSEHPDTESLRVALRGYRHFLERILDL